MPVDVNDVMQLLSTLSRDQNLRVTVKESVRGGIIAGVTTALGGVMGGPPGLAIGGVVGGGLAYMVGKDKFKPVSEVIKEMSENDKRVLYNDCMRIINNLQYTDLIMLTAMIQNDPLTVRQLMCVVVNHLQSNLKMEIVD